MTVNDFLLGGLTLCCAVGVLYLAVAAWAVRRFVALPRTQSSAGHGDEAALW